MPECVGDRHPFGEGKRQKSKGKSKTLTVSWRSYVAQPTNSLLLPFTFCLLTLSEGSGDRLSKW
ncbi:MAG: hypothetical protein AB4426_02935 [Xenococcaceae cyanobacterium]